MIKLKDLLEATALPGMSLLIKSKSLIVKLIWLLFISLFGTCCIHFTRKSLLDYFSYNTVTNMNIIKQNETQFPTVSFCIHLSNTNQLKNISLNDYIISCRFDFKNCKLDQDFQIYSLKRGILCFRFNSNQNEIKNISRIDTDTGLSVLFRIKEYQKQYLSYLNIKNQVFKMSVYIQNYSTVFRIDRFSYDSGLQLSPGYSYIQVEREFIQNLPQPYNKCIKQDTTDYISNVFQYFIQNNKTYLQKDCFDFCIEEIILKQCNCSENIKLGEIAKCFVSSNESGYCITELVSKYSVFKTILMPDICYQKCPIECDYIVYNTKQNYVSSLPDSYLKENKLQNISKDDLILINVYYPKLEYISVEQMAKTEFFDLVSNIGGTFGLFLGLSFFTFVEIIEIIFELLNEFIIKKKFLILNNH
jgi:hypothetical protein